MVATKLDSKLRDHISNSRTNLFSENERASTLQRPGMQKNNKHLFLLLILSYTIIVLLILDRSMDLTPMLSHSWTYQALIHDVLELRLNRITVDADECINQTRKSYDIDNKDFFWNKNASNPFPQVAGKTDGFAMGWIWLTPNVLEDIDIELNRYKTDAAEITRISGVNSLEDVGQL